MQSTHLSECRVLAVKVGARLPHGFLASVHHSRRCRGRWRRVAPSQTACWSMSQPQVAGRPRDCWSDGAAPPMTTASKVHGLTWTEYVHSSLHPVARAYVSVKPTHGVHPVFWFTAKTSVACPELFNFLFSKIILTGSKYPKRERVWIESTVDIHPAEKKYLQWNHDHKHVHRVWRYKQNNAALMSVNW